MGASAEFASARSTFERGLFRRGRRGGGRRRRFFGVVDGGGRLGDRRLDVAHKRVGSGSGGRVDGDGVHAHGHVHVHAHVHVHRNHNHRRGRGLWWIVGRESEPGKREWWRGKRVRSWLGSSNAMQCS